MVKKSADKIPKQPKAKKKHLLHSPLRLQVDNLYDLQKLRISMQLRIFAYIAILGLTEEHSKVKALKRDADILISMEKSIDKMIKEELIKYKIYTEALRLVKGLGGPRIAGGIIAWTESFDKEAGKKVGIERFATVSKYWKYCGLDVAQYCPECGKPLTRNEEKEYVCTWKKCELSGEIINESNVINRAPRRVKGQLAGWNTKLHMHYIYKVGGQMIKTANFFQGLYRRKKEFYQKEHPDSICECGAIVIAESSKAGHGYKVTDPETGKKHKCSIKKPSVKYTKGHIHSMARRAMVKIVAQNIWHIWRKLEGHSVTKPYGFELPGPHSEVIHPPEWDHFFKEEKMK